MKAFKTIKQLFCKHDFSLCVIYLQEDYSTFEKMEYQCRKCGKTISILPSGKTTALDKCILESARRL